MSELIKAVESWCATNNYNFYLNIKNVQSNNKNSIYAKEFLYGIILFVQTQNEEDLSSLYIAILQTKALYSSHLIDRGEYIVFCKNAQ